MVLVLRASKRFIPQFRSFSASIMDTMAAQEGGKPMQIISEGTATMHYDPDETVFYNKVQVLNRDLSIQVIKLYAEKLKEERIARQQQRSAKAADTPAEADDQGITVLDALAASGLRSIRYLKEVPQVRHLTINDLSSTATALAQDNCQRNEVEQAKVIISNQDATILMYSHRLPADRYDVIDLDPYGSAVPFLDSAVQAVANGGLLCVTCTDMTALAGSFPEVCFAKYGAMPVKAKYSHEMALRILLHAIDATANKYKRHIVPWLSMSVDFYVRVFVRVFESAAEVKRSCLKRAMVLQSAQTPSFLVHPLGHRKYKKEGTEGGIGGTFGACVLSAAGSACEESGGPMRMGGPFWSDPIHDQAIVDELLQRVQSPADIAIPTAKRLGGILASMSDELKDVPLYYSLPDLASTAQIGTPTIAEFSSALRNAGYRYSQFHHDPHAVKTDAPNAVVWDIIRAHAKAHPPVFSAKKGQSALSQRILSKEVSTEVDLSHEKRVRDRGVTRFPPNPEANWGPKRRAGKGQGSAQHVPREQGGGEEVQEREAKRCKVEQEEEEDQRR